MLRLMSTDAVERVDLSGLNIVKEFSNVINLFKQSYQVHIGIQMRCERAAIPWLNGKLLSRHSTTSIDQSERVTNYTFCLIYKNTIFSRNLEVFLHDFVITFVRLIPIEPFFILDLYY